MRVRLDKHVTPDIDDGMLIMIDVMASGHSVRLDKHVTADKNQCVSVHALHTAAVKGIEIDVTSWHNALSVVLNTSPFWPCSRICRRHAMPSLGITDTSALLLLLLLLFSSNHQGNDG